MRTFGAVLVMLAVNAVSHAQGIMLSTSGTVNRSMGGAATAAPIDVNGTLQWNPAGLTQLRSQATLSADLVLPVLTTSSSIAGLVSGSSDAEPGVSAVPNFGLVHSNEDSLLSYGFGVAGVAGFRTNYSSSMTNPIFTPQANTPGAPGGFGRLYTEAAFLEIGPSVGVQLTDNLSAGFGPTITLGQLIVDPLIFVAPDDSDGSAVPRYPSGRGTRMHGAEDSSLVCCTRMTVTGKLGTSVRSRQWMEDFAIDQNLRLDCREQNDLTSIYPRLCQLALPSLVSIER